MPTYAEAQAGALSEIKAAVQASDAEEGEKIDALVKALELSLNAAYTCETTTSQALGDGRFLAVLLELMKVLLPILLEIMKKTP